MYKQFLRRNYFVGRETITLTVDEANQLIQHATNEDDLSLNSRKLAFAAKVLSIGTEKYDHQMLRDFISYWAEHNDNGRAMRFEMKRNQPFNISRRLGTWSKNAINNKSNGKQTAKNFTPQQLFNSTGE